MSRSHTTAPCSGFVIVFPAKPLLLMILLDFLTDTEQRRCLFLQQYHEDVQQRDFGAFTTMRGGPTGIPAQAAVRRFRTRRQSTNPPSSAHPSCPSQNILRSRTPRQRPQPLHCSRPHPSSHVRQPPGPRGPRARAPAGHEATSSALAASSELGRHRRVRARSPAVPPRARRPTCPLSRERHARAGGGGIERGKKGRRQIGRQHRPSAVM